MVTCHLCCHGRVGYTLTLVSYLSALTHRSVLSCSSFFSLLPQNVLFWSFVVSRQTRALPLYGEGIILKNFDLWVSFYFCHQLETEILWFISFCLSPGDWLQNPRSFISAIWLHYRFLQFLLLGAWLEVAHLFCFGLLLWHFTCSALFCCVATFCLWRICVLYSCYV